MNGSVERVRELTASALVALPRDGELSTLTDSSATALLAELSTLRRHIDATISLVAADIERKSARELGAQSLARRAGVRSGAELVQKITGVTRAEAAKAVRVGGMLEAANAIAPGGTSPAADPGPRSRAALESLAGRWDTPIAVAVRNRWLSADQGDRLKAGLSEPRDVHSAPKWRAAALQLITDCWESELTPEGVKRAATALRACLDREWAGENAHRLREQRSLKRFVRGDGMVKYELLVDPLTDQQIWTPIFRHLAPRLGGPRFLTEEEQQRADELELDPRSNEQLLADAFTGFLSAGVGASGGFGSYAPTVSIAVATTELRAAVAADTQQRGRGRVDHTRCATPHPDGTQQDADTGPPGDAGIAWAGTPAEPVTGSELLAAVCDGRVGAILLDDTGQALDVSKHERLFSVRQRQAMALRDGGCLHPGCSMPPAACEAHHINPWSDSPGNRKSETRDGVLLCRFHHLNLHNHGARVRRRGSGYWLHWPGRDAVRLAPKHGLIAQLRAEGAIA